MMSLEPCLMCFQLVPKWELARHSMICPQRQQEQQQQTRQRSSSQGTRYWNNVNNIQQHYQHSQAQTPPQLYRMGIRNPFDMIDDGSEGDEQGDAEDDESKEGETKSDDDEQVIDPYETNESRDTATPNKLPTTPCDTPAQADKPCCNDGIVVSNQSPCFNNASSLWHHDDVQNEPLLLSQRLQQQQQHRANQHGSVEPSKRNPLQTYANRSALNSFKIPVSPPSPCSSSDTTHDSLYVACERDKQQRQLEAMYWNFRIEQKEQHPSADTPCIRTIHSHDLLEEFRYWYEKLYEMKQLPMQKMNRDGTCRIQQYNRVVLTSQNIHVDVCNQVHYHFVESLLLYYLSLDCPHKFDILSVEYHYNPILLARYHHFLRKINSYCEQQYTFFRPLNRTQLGHVLQFGFEQPPGIRKVNVQIRPHCKGAC